MNQILDVDLLEFENSSGAPRRAVVDGVTRSLATGFVCTRHDVSEDLIDTACGMLAGFFSLDDGERYSVVQFCHPRRWRVLAARSELLHTGAPAAVQCDHGRECAR